ncbi:MAG: potassium transporter KefB [Candidatus Zixiibacteriota bacterium]|nr:MAG: potassium transporter KefB [candidate division Zixibacteria bacterium]
MEIQFLQEIVVIFALSILVIYVFHRLRMPELVGFLLTGVIAGPHGLGLIQDVGEVEVLAQIGIVLLLFTIGIEFSLQNFLTFRRAALLGGATQVFLTLLAGYAIARTFQRPIGEALFIGFLAVHSSTTITMRVFQSRGEVVSPHGGITVAVSVFQDLISVPQILVVPLLAGMAGNMIASLLSLLGMGIALILFMVIAARWVVPFIMHQVARTRSRELFILSVLVICGGVAWLTSSMGLSLALGAFLAGLIVSESEYSHNAFGNILPFRDVFTSFFFVSIGMLMDVRFMLQHPGLIIILALAVLLIKSSIAGLAALVLGYPLRTVVMVGLALSQIGEFAFILSNFGLQYNLLDEAANQVFLSVTVVTMAMTPFLINTAPRLADRMALWPLPQRIKTGIRALPPDEHQDLRNHLVIVGFGLVGRNVARAARAAGISYAIVELNPVTVRAERARGEPIYYGDATQEAVLDLVDLRNALVVVAAIPDPVATERITELARRMNPEAYIIIRTRYLQEMQPLHQLGADEVIPEEFETSVEIFARVLAQYQVPRDEIDRLIAQVRADRYEMFRGLDPEAAAPLNLDLPELEVGTLRVTEQSDLAGKSLADLELNRRFGLTVLVIQRGSNALTIPHGGTQLEDHDLLYVLGRPEDLAAAAGLFRPSPVTGTSHAER